MKGLSVEGGQVLPRSQKLFNTEVTTLMRRPMGSGKRVKVSNKTHSLLEDFKEEEEIGTFDGAIRILLERDKQKKE